MRIFLVRGQSLPTLVTDREVIRLRDDVGKAHEDDVDVNDDVLLVRSVAGKSSSSLLQLPSGREILLLAGGSGFRVSPSEAGRLLSSPLLLMFS